MTILSFMMNNSASHSLTSASFLSNSLHLERGSRNSLDPLGKTVRWSYFSHCFTFPLVPVSLFTQLLFHDLSSPSSLLSLVTAFTVLLCLLSLHPAHLKKLNCAQTQPGIPTAECGWRRNPTLLPGLTLNSWLPPSPGRSELPHRPIRRLFLLDYSFYCPSIISFLISLSSQSVFQFLYFYLIILLSISLTLHCRVLPSYQPTC